MARRKSAKWTMQVFGSMEAADKANRDYWWSKTPAARLRELERLRQLDYGYAHGRPRPKFQRVLTVVGFGSS